MDLLTSYLDSAIHISFIILELELYKNIIEGKDVQISLEIALQVQNGDWTSLLKKRETALHYLNMIGDLSDVQD